MKKILTLMLLSAVFLNAETYKVGFNFIDDSIHKDMNLTGMPLSVNCNVPNHEVLSGNLSELPDIDNGYGIVLEFTDSIPANSSYGCTLVTDNESLSTFIGSEVFISKTKPAHGKTMKIKLREYDKDNGLTKITQGYYFLNKKAEMFVDVHAWVDINSDGELNKGEPDFKGLHLSATNQDKKHSASSSIAETVDTAKNGYARFYPNYVRNVYSYTDPAAKVKASKTILGHKYTKAKLTNVSIVLLGEDMPSGFSLAQSNVSEHNDSDFIVEQDLYYVEATIVSSKSIIDNYAIGLVPDETFKLDGNITGLNKSSPEDINITFFNTSDCSGDAYQTTSPDENGNFTFDPILGGTEHCIKYYSSFIDNSESNLTDINISDGFEMLITPLLIIDFADEVIENNDSDNNVTTPTDNNNSEEDNSTTPADDNNDTIPDGNGGFGNEGSSTDCAIHGCKPIVDKKVSINPLFILALFLLFLYKRKNLTTSK